MRKVADMSDQIKLNLIIQNHTSIIHPSQTHPEPDGFGR